MFKKLKAFTMAEAILVMTILGIIATIMISTLKPAEYKEKSMQIMAKKVLSEIDVATTQVLMNNTVDGTLNTVKEYLSDAIVNENSVEPANTLLHHYLVYISALRETTNGGVALGSSARILKDGAYLRSYFAVNSCDYIDSIFPGETNTVKVWARHGYIRFDINHNEPPNVYGKDRFRLPLYEHGIDYNGESAKYCENEG